MFPELSYCVERQNDAEGQISWEKEGRFLELGKEALFIEWKM